MSPTFGHLWQCWYASPLLSGIKWIVLSDSSANSSTYQMSRWILIGCMWSMGMATTTFGGQLIIGSFTNCLGWFDFAWPKTIIHQLSTIGGTQLLHRGFCLEIEPLWSEASRIVKWCTSPYPTNSQCALASSRARLATSGTSTVCQDTCEFPPATSECGEWWGQCSWWGLQWLPAPPISQQPTLPAHAPPC